MRHATSGRAADTDERTQPAEEDVLDTAVTGSNGPIPGVEAPSEEHQLEILHHGESRTGTALWWVGVHHGAGASTLARLHGQDPTEALHHWPYHPDGQQVVLVARETAQGLTAAKYAAQDYAAGSIPGTTVLALVTVPAQKGKPHPNVQHLLNLLTGVFPRHYRAEWHPEYMAHLDPLDARPNHGNQRIIRTINRLTKG